MGSPSRTVAPPYGADRIGARRSDAAPRQRVVELWVVRQRSVGGDVCSPRSAPPGAAFDRALLRGRRHRCSAATVVRRDRCGPRSGGVGSRWADPGGSRGRRTSQCRRQGRRAAHLAVGRPCAELGLFVSGRASIEMVQKAWAGGFGPSSRSVRPPRLPSRPPPGSMTLAGFVRQRITTSTRRLPRPPGACVFLRAATPVVGHSVLAMRTSALSTWIDTVETVSAETT